MLRYFLCFKTHKWDWLVTDEWARETSNFLGPIMCEKSLNSGPLPASATPNKFKADSSTSKQLKRGKRSAWASETINVMKSVCWESTKASQDSCRCVWYCTVRYNELLSSANLHRKICLFPDCQANLREVSSCRFSLVKKAAWGADSTIQPRSCTSVVTEASVNYSKAICLLGIRVTLSGQFVMDGESLLCEGMKGFIDTEDIPWWFCISH